MNNKFLYKDANRISSAVRKGEVSAREITEAFIQRATTLNDKYNCFSQFLSNRALKEADRVDEIIGQGGDPGVLAGVPYGVKNLFDVEGVTTLAGSIMYKGQPAAEKDATVIKRLQKSGAILIGALHMSEFAYGYTNENSHYGPVKNPHDLTRVSGGSSGGSGSSVAAGMVAFSLGSDTNGSIRLPAALCGVFGFKQTYGALSRFGTKMFASSFDHVGPLARSVEDIAATYDAMCGPDPNDPVCHGGKFVSLISCLNQKIDGLRLASLDGYFKSNGSDESYESVNQVCKALNVTKSVKINNTDSARGAAFVITHCEGGLEHANDIRNNLDKFDPTTRSGFITGTLLPANWYVKAQKFRSWYRTQVLNIFNEFDVLLAPATPFSATKIGQKTMKLDGSDVPVLSNLGIYAQPLSFIGLPILSVPIHGIGDMPHGVQLIAAPGKESSLIKIASYLQNEGICVAPIANDAV